MEYGSRKLLFVCILAFTEGMMLILTSGLSFKKYDYDQQLGGYTCGPNEAIFETDGKFDPTGKLPDLKSWCESTYGKLSKLNRTECRHILERRPSAESGLYKIALRKSKKVITVFCDMNIDGGGWTVFHNRFDGSTDFYRNFSEYENGFGAPDGEFWLGLKYTQEIASQGATEIRLEMKKQNGEEGYETYKDFKLTHGTDYVLSIDKNSARQSGLILPDSSFDANVGNAFSTYDRDYFNTNMAIERHGAWWYGAGGTYANLNGRYCQPGTQCRDQQYGSSGHIHVGFARDESLKASRMLIRRV